MRSFEFGLVLKLRVVWICWVDCLSAVMNLSKVKMGNAFSF